MARERSFLSAAFSKSSEKAENDTGEAENAPAEVSFLNSALTKKRRKQTPFLFKQPPPDDAA